MANETIGEFEVVENPGKKENPAGEDQRRPPAKEGDAPAACVCVPLEGRIIGGSERHPDEKAAEREILRGAMMADVGAAERKAEEEFRGHACPGNCDSPGMP